MSASVNQPALGDIPRLEENAPGVLDQRISGDWRDKKTAWVKTRKRSISLGKF